MKLRCCSFRFIKADYFKLQFYDTYFSVFPRNLIKTCWNNAVVENSPPPRDIEKACSWAANIYDTYIVSRSRCFGLPWLLIVKVVNLSESCVPRWEEQTCNWRITTGFQRGDKHSVGNEKKKKRNKHSCFCSTCKICCLNKTINKFANFSLTHDTIY